MSADVAAHAEHPGRPDPQPAQPASRRERVRAATSQEILQVARGLLIAHGSAAISLRAIAREMGMTAPALYRYYGSHEELTEHLIADIFTELSDYLQSAIAAAAPAGSPGPAAAEVPGQTDQMAVKLITACRAFRDWALAHAPEFGMIFGSPIPGIGLNHEDPLSECGYRFGQIFLDLFTRLWQHSPFPVPADEEIDASLRPQLARYREMTGSGLPLGVLLAFLRCWVLLYGTVSLEVFGHLRFALDDAAPMFELMLSDLAPMVGLEYPLPGPGTRSPRA